jgi:prepilin-type N-terminal cleavage/methylation domain-containing protein
MRNQEGFTVVEMLVTVVVAAIFAFMFYQLFISSTKLSDQARHDSEAAQIAYSDLKKYPTATSTGQTASCASPNAITTIPLGTNTYPDVGTVTETLNVSWPFACTTPAVAKVEVIVSYKGGLKEITEASYVD